MATKAQQAMGRLTSLRNVGFPAMLTSEQAWHLSGGIKGASDGSGDDVSLAAIAQDVPDCLEFAGDALERMHA